MSVSKPRKTGFTLIELLVVIGIVAILIALLLPAVQAARMAARRTQNRNNLRQIGVALHNYHDTHRAFPPGWIGVENGAPDVEGGNGFGWAVMILPMLEQSNLYYNAFNLRDSIMNNDPDEIFVPLPVFRSPNDPSNETWDIVEEGNETNVLAALPTANYVGNFGTTELEDCETLPPGEVCLGDGIFFHNSAVRFSDVSDGTSRTFLVGERRTDTDKEPPWHSTWVGVIPEGEEAFARILGVADHHPNFPEHLDDYSSYDPGGVHFLFVDGRVQFVGETIDEEVYQALATRRGGEQVGAGF